MTKFDKYLLPLFLLIPIFLGAYQHLSKADASIATISRGQISNIEEKDKMLSIDKIKESYWNIHVNGILSASDPDFTSFALITFDGICPFYKPDGSTYRSCLWDFVENMRSKSTETEVQTAYDYCVDFVEKTGYENTAMKDLFLTCIAYKLSLYIPN